MPDIFPVSRIGKGQLLAMPMPAPDDLQATMASLRHQGIGKLVCLLETTESQNLALQQEQTICEHTGLCFERFAIPDFGVPNSADLYKLVMRLTGEIQSGQNIVVHCRGGIGRTGLVCCCILIASGMDAASAIILVSAQRGCTVPETDSQLEMIYQFTSQQPHSRQR